MTTYDPTALDQYPNVLAWATESYNDGYTAGYAQGKADQAAADNPPVWTEDWADLSQWGVYNGAGSYAQQGIRLAGNVYTLLGGPGDPGDFCRVFVGPVGGNGVTIGGHTLQPTDYAAGGVYPTNAKFGPGHKWVTSVRMSAPADGTRGVFMLWGDDSGTVKWPASGELDFIEAGAQRADRQSCTVTNHWKAASGGNAQRQYVVTGDLTVWTPVEVVWAADNSSIDIWFDGVQVASFTDNLPPGLASFRFQTALEGGGQAPTYNGQPRQPSWIDCGPINIYKLGGGA